MQSDYSNRLLTGQVGIQLVRLLAGRPQEAVVRGAVTELVFGPGQVFCYLFYLGNDVSCWLVRNEPGEDRCPELVHPARLLLEVSGTQRDKMKSFLSTLKYLHAESIALERFDHHACRLWEVLLDSPEYQPDWVLEALPPPLAVDGLS